MTFSEALIYGMVIIAMMVIIPLCAVTYFQRRGERRNRRRRTRIEL